MVHYIRFLRVPQIKTQDKGLVKCISAVLTVTTDLGEAYFPEDLDLIVRLVDFHQPKDVVDNLRVMWRKNDRVVKFQIRHKMRNSAHAMRIMRLHVSTKRTDNLLAKDHHLPEVLDAWSSSFRFDVGGSTEDLVERRMQLTNDTCVKIWEETGESIARHIWDGALGCLELYKYLLQPDKAATMMPLLHQLLMKQMHINVVELGSGCGVAGIGLAQMVPGSKVMLTDLQEAQEIITKNINHASLPAGSSLKQEVLDWDMPLSATEDHKNVDLLIVCECIYNADSDPALISVLQQFIKYSPEVKILVITKKRHWSETVFFDLMEEVEILLLEQCRITLPHHISDADSETPQAEIYLYRAPETVKKREQPI